MFFEPPPHQNRCSPFEHPPPRLKKEAPPSEKQPPPPLKREAPFHVMIPRKSTINNNLKSSSNPSKICVFSKCAGLQAYSRQLYYQMNSFTGISRQHFKPTPPSQCSPPCIDLSPLPIKFSPCSQHLWETLRRWGVFHFGMKYLQGKYCPDHVEILPWTSRIQSSRDGLKNVLNLHRVRLNGSWFVNHDRIFNFHDWILFYLELFYGKIKR